MVLDSGYLGDISYVAAAALRAMGAMGYDAVGMHYRDYLLGQDFLTAAREAAVPVVSTTELAQRLHGDVLPSKVLEAEGTTIGVASLFWPRDVPDYTPAVLAARAASVLRRLRDQCDVVVLLSQLSLDLDKTLLGFPQIRGMVDLVIGGVSAASLREPLLVNGTTIVPTSRHGWEVGVVEVSLDRRRRPHFAVGLKHVGISLPEDPVVTEIIAPALARQARERRRAALRGVPTGPFEPASVCGRCHQAELADWRQTAHAAALETLRREDEMREDCLPCHSEAYRRTRRIVRDPTPDEGVQCSSCHGMGVRHSEGEQPGDVMPGVSPATCRQCHTPERAEFNFEEDVKRVNHRRPTPAPLQVARRSAD